MNILVTGCSRGVGLEICRVLLEKEYVVFGIARTYTPEFELLEKTYPNRLYLIFVNRKVCIKRYLRTF